VIHGTQGSRPTLQHLRFHQTFQPTTDTTTFTLPPDFSSAQHDPTNATAIQNGVSATVAIEASDTAAAGATVVPTPCPLATRTSATTTTSRSSPRHGGPTASSRTASARSSLSERMVTRSQARAQQDAAPTTHDLRARSRVHSEDDSVPLARRDVASDASESESVGAAAATTTSRSTQRHGGPTTSPRTASARSSLSERMVTRSQARAQHDAAPTTHGLPARSREHSRVAWRVVDSENSEADSAGETVAPPPLAASRRSAVSITSSRSTARTVSSARTLTARTSPSERMVTRSAARAQNTRGTQAVSKSASSVTSRRRLRRMSSVDAARAA
jgi:hypothetical protein